MKISEYNEMMAYLLRPRQKFANGGRIGFSKAGFIRSKGYRGLVSDERLKLEKKLPLIRKLYLEGLSVLGIAEKLNTDEKKIEVILNELRGRSVTNIGGKKVKSGYNIPEDTPRGKLYKANRITKAEEEARGRGGSDKKTSPKRKEVIEAAKKDATKLTSTEIAEKYNISKPTQRKLGIKAISEREKYKDKYLKSTITKYGKNLIKVLKKNPSLITNQNELFKKAKVPKNSTSSVINALNINQTLDSGKKRFDIPKSISKLIPKIYGPVETAESVFREAGASPQEIKSALTRPSIALQESFIPEGSGSTKMKGTIFEHAFPKSLIPYIKNKNIQRQLFVTGERTSPFLNSFKTRFDVLQKGAVTKFLEDGNLSAYNKKINEIRNTVRKLTGGYEIGYIKFDKNKNATPMVKAKPVSEGLKEFGTETTQKVSAFKNAKYTSNLLRNFKKDPNNINYSTLRKEINANQVSDEVIKLSDEAAKAYEKAKPFLGFKDKFLNFAQKNLDNKLVGTLFKKPTGKISLITGAALFPTALMADETGAAEVVPGTEQLRSARESFKRTDEEGFSDTEKLLAGTTAGSALFAARKPILKTLGKVARPFGFPSVAAGFALKELTSEDPNLGIAGAELLAPELIKTVAPRGAGIMSQIGRFAANPFFKGARLFTPIGLGLMGIEGIKMGMEEQERLDRMRIEDPEQYEEIQAFERSLLEESA